jgi:hypothetical protein
VGVGVVGGRPRVRLHLADPAPNVSLPSVEGVLLSRRGREYVIGVPELMVAPGGVSEHLADARELRVPRERVAFYEVLRG